MKHSPLSGRRGAPVSVDPRAGAGSPATAFGHHGPAPRPETLAARAGDLITPMLEQVRITTWVAGLSTASGRWTLVPPADTGGFHAVIEGRMMLRESGGVVHELTAGDVAVVARGGTHIIGDHPDSPAVPLSTLITREGAREHRGLRIGDGPPEVSFLGGFIVMDGPAGGRLRDALPDVVVLRRAERAPGGVVDAVIRLLTVQTLDASPGTNAVMTELVTLLVIEAAREWMSRVAGRRNGRAAAGGSWARALLDEHVGPVLALLHAEPGRDWSLSAMANEAGVSRTVLYERFTGLVGQPPAAYLRELRLEMAAALLLEAPAPLEQLARRVGYSSPGAFASAFKRRVGVTPGEYRRRNLATREAS